MNKSNNTYRKIKTKPVDARSNAYIESGKEINKDLKFKVGDVRISKHKNVSKVYVPNWSKKFLWLKKLKTLCRRTDLNREEIVRTF